MIARARITAGGSYFSAPKPNIPFIDSGCQTLNLALGGGWAESRIANIVGDKSTGKTLLCIEASANFAMKYKKGRIRYREAEAAFDQPYAKALGMPLDRIDFGEPLETVEDMFEDLTKIVSGAKSDELVIVDSLDALSDRAEMLRDMDAGSYGAEKAKKLSQLFRRLVRTMAEKKVTLIIVSQVRDKIGLSFGRNTTRSGGKALDFYASQVVYLAHVGRLTKTVSGLKRITGVKVQAKIDKNKVGLPFREAAFQIRFGYGIDDAQACVDWLNEVGKLKEVGINKEDSKFYLNELLDMSREDADVKLQELRAACERNWYLVESKLLPSRSKYV